MLMAQRLPVAAKIGAAILTVAAALGTPIAYAEYQIFCVEYDGSVACLGHRAEFVWHLVTAIPGLGAALTMLWATLRGRRRLACAALVAGLVLFALSFLLSDAGTHGWHNLKVYPQL